MVDNPIAIDMAEFPSAPDQTISPVTPTNVKRKTWRYAPEDAAKLSVMRPEKPRQDSAIGLCGGQIPSPIAALSKDHRWSTISKPEESQRSSQMSTASADQQDSHILKGSHDNENHHEFENHTDSSTTSSCRKDVPMPVDVTSLFTVHPDDLDFDFDQFDFPTGPRLSRPFFMPTPVLNKKRGSALISRRSVASVELSLKTRRRTQDSDTLSPACLSPSELQRLYVECIPQRSSFRGDQAQPAMPAIILPTTPVDKLHPHQHKSGLPHNPQQGKGRVPSILRQDSKSSLQHQCSNLSMGQAGLAERVDDANQMLAESKERLYRAKKDLYIREEHCREIEVRATNMKYGMEEAMRKYTATSKELTSLKTFKWECSLSIPAQVLSMRQRKIHGELKIQIRDLERNLNTTMGDLRSKERKWKEAQIALATCTQDLEKQKSIVDDKSKKMRIAGEAKTRLTEMLARAKQEQASRQEQSVREEGAVAPQDTNDPEAELVAVNKKAHRLSQHLISEVEAECEESRSKIQRMKRASVITPDSMLQEELMMAKRELREREELLGVVKRTNADLARKIADMEHKLGGRKHWSGSGALS